MRTVALASYNLDSMLWCEPRGATDEAWSKEKFYVINGGYDALLTSNGNLIVNDMIVSTHVKKVWEGECPYSEYNAAISWIKKNMYQPMKMIESYTFSMTYDKVDEEPEVDVLSALDAFRI